MAALFVTSVVTGLVAADPLRPGTEDNGLTERRIVTVIEEELTALGFIVSILAQDGSEKPDARASHPDVDERFAIEVETTTPENPAKVLTNLRKAQEAGDIPLFVVRLGNDETEWAERVDGILTPPVRELQSGETRFYTTDSNLTFNGGATEEGGVTAVRPGTDDENGTQNIWRRDGDEVLLRDASGTEHIRLPSLANLSKDRVPAHLQLRPHCRGVHRLRRSADPRTSDRGAGASPGGATGRR